MQLACDICGEVFDYPFEQNTHCHSEAELDGVPVNFWSQKFNLEKGSLDKDIDALGIFKFQNYFQIPLIKKISLNEGNTPLSLFRKNIFLKDEAVNPTGSFKDRGMPLLMNEALLHKKKKIAIVSTGNAAISLCKYAKQYGLKSIVFVPKDTPSEKMKRIAADDVFISKDIIKSFEDFFLYCRKNKDVFNGYLSSNISYLLGLETIAYELYEQLKDIETIILPCASGGNAVAQITAYIKLYKLGLIKKIPHFIIVQIIGGDPIAQGIKKNKKDSLFIIKHPAPSKTILSEDTCFNYFKLIKFYNQGFLSTMSISDKEIDDFIQKNGNMGYDYTSLSVFAAVTKYNQPSKKTVLIVTAKNFTE